MRNSDSQVPPYISAGARPAPGIQDFGATSTRLRQLALRCRSGSNQLGKYLSLPEAVGVIFQWEAALRPPFSLEESICAGVLLSLTTIHGMQGHPMCPVWPFGPEWPRSAYVDQNILTLSPDATLMWFQARAATPAILN